MPIRFALVDSANLQLEDLQVDPVYVEINAGDDIDPTTLQLIYEDAQVQGVFRRARADVNGLCVKWFSALTKNKARVSRKRRKEQTSAAIRQATSSLRGEINKVMKQVDPDLRRAVSQACNKNAKLRAAYAAERVTWRVGAGFGAVNVIVNLAAAYFLGNASAGIAAAATLTRSARALYETSKSEQTLRLELIDIFRQLDAHESAQSAWQVVQLWNYVSGGFDISSAKAKLETYEGCLNRLDEQARQLSTDLSVLLDRLGASSPGAAASPELSALIEKIVAQNQAVAAGRRFCGRALRTIAAAFRRGEYEGNQRFQVLRSLVPSWQTYIAVGWAVTGGGGFEDLLDLVKDSVQDEMQDFLRGQAKKISGRVRGANINALDVYDVCMFAIDPPDNLLSQAQTAADLVGKAMEKLDDEGVKDTIVDWANERYNTTLFGDVFDGVKDFAENLNDALDGGDDEGGDDD